MIVHNKGLQMGEFRWLIHYFRDGWTAPSIPNKLWNQVVFIDNIACVHGWESKLLKEDTTASILILALHLIEAFLSSVIHICYTPCKSNWESTMVDQISRVKSVLLSDKDLLSSFHLPLVAQPLFAWLISLNEDWNLLLVNVVQTCS